MIKVLLSDGGGKGLKSRLDDLSNQQVVVHPYPPTENTKLVLPFRQYLTDDGTSSGSQDMRVDGSTNPVDFFINATGTEDIYIKRISVVIEDAGAVINEFANIGELSNGIDFLWSTSESGEISVASSLRTNFDLIQLGGGTPAFGTGNAAFRITNASSSDEAFIPSIDLKEDYGFPWGLRLRKGSEDRITFRVNDDLSSGISRFDIVCQGIRL